MNKKRVLVLSTYPIKNPQHGGQKRVAAIVNAYKANFGSVKFVAVFHRGFYSAYTRDDIYATGQTKRAIDNMHFTGDVILGEAIYKDKAVKQRLTNLLTTYKPDIVEVAQVWPYMGLKPLLDELQMYPKIVFGSQNIEYKMKQEMLQSLGRPADEITEVTQKIKEAEQRLCQEADVTVAVSKEDAIEYQRLGAKKVVIGMNGIELQPAPSAAVAYWKQYLQKRSVRKVITFVGSAHPPNWFGFLSMVGDRLGFIAPDTKLFLAGSISDYFVNTFTERIPEHVTFWQRAEAAGRLSDERLAGLLEISDVILLPITEGGGSNLKTAEAILSGKKIVATHFAFRSFENYLDLPNIYLADNKKGFQAAIHRALEASYVPRTKEQEKLAQQVQWQYCLADAMKEIDQL